MKISSGSRELPPRRLALVWMTTTLVNFTTLVLRQHLRWLGPHVHIFVSSSESATHARTKHSPHSTYVRDRHHHTYGADSDDERRSALCVVEAGVVVVTTRAFVWVLGVRKQGGVVWLKCASTGWFHR